MGRSFGIVEQKIEESEFFLEKIETNLLSEISFGETQFYLSAFVSSTRSITFTIQASISDLPEFKEWYEPQQAALKANKLARFFLEARNLSQKIGYYLIGGGRTYKDENGDTRMHHYFQTFNSPKTLKDIPEEDVSTACVNYFKVLLSVVVNCYQKFGDIIDPEKFFTYENMLKTEKTIEDFEEQAGYQRGWTAIPELTIEERIDLIKRHHPMPTIDWIFEKRLGTNRFGEPEEE